MKNAVKLLSFHYGDSSHEPQTFCKVEDHKLRDSIGFKEDHVVMLAAGRQFCKVFLQENLFRDFDYL